MTKQNRNDHKIADQPEDDNDVATENNESNKPDFYIKQYRSIRTDSGMKTRKETIGAIWQNAANGMLTIRFNGVQVINNDVFAHPVTYDFNS